MKRLVLKKIVFFVIFIPIIISCNKKSWDEYYARPNWLAKPIYQQLDSMGDFKSFLVCIEKAGYKNVLGAGSSWTVFAPTDAAFSKFLSEQRIADVNSIDKVLAEKIVRTAMVYDGERLEKLNDNFSARGWVPKAFRGVQFTTILLKQRPLPLMVEPEKLLLLTESRVQLMLQLIITISI
ncbi:MAG: fasciclin domain-containing protein [Sphingobacteriales bacterium]|nr:fasciclin domain-containing protein [Sphingobacteriales bacterium]